MSPDKIAQMSAPDLANLYANVQRLQASDGPHRTAAVAMVAPIEQELAARLAAAPPKPATVRKPRAKAAAVKA